MVVNPVCIKSGPCFAKSAKTGEVRCIALNDSYPLEKCPFQKPKKEYTTSRDNIVNAYIKAHKRLSSEKELVTERSKVLAEWDTVTQVVREKLIRKYNLSINP